jgi:hypothetical protein
VPNENILDLDVVSADDLDLFAEELPDQLQMWSDCLSSASSFSCAGGCFASFGSVGSVISCV